MKKLNIIEGEWELKHRGYGINIEPSVAWIGFGSAHDREKYEATAPLLQQSREMYNLLCETRQLAWREAVIRADGELGRPYLDELIKRIDAVLKAANTPFKQPGA